MAQRKDKQVVFVSENASRLVCWGFFSHVQVERFLELYHIPLTKQLCYSSRLKMIKFKKLHKFFFLKFWQLSGISIKRIKSYLFCQHALRTQNQQDHSIIKPSRISVLHLQSSEEIPDLNGQRMNQSTFTSISIFASLG